MAARKLKTIDNEVVLERKTKSRSKALGNRDYFNRPIGVVIAELLGVVKEYGPEARISFSYYNYGSAWKVRWVEQESVEEHTKRLTTLRTRRESEVKKAKTMLATLEEKLEAIK